jgi:hypothetical protein
MDVLVFAQEDHVCDPDRRWVAAARGGERLAEGRILQNVLSAPGCFAPPEAAGSSIVANREVGMRLAERLVWGLLIVVVDAAAFAVPLAALVVAYVVLARPAWFREWVGRLYREGPR